MDNNNLDRISYALGLSMGNNFRASGIQELNVGDFADGVAAVFNGSQPKMTYDEAKADQLSNHPIEHLGFFLCLAAVHPDSQIQKFFSAMEEKQRAEASKMAEVNEREGKEYLEKNGKRPEVKTLPSGLQYEVLKEGTGISPEAKDQVEVHYTGTLLDGTKFDSSVDRGVPATFGVTQVALQLMREGDKWRLFIPSQLAYGPSGTPGGPIGPNQTLLFDVELLKVYKAEA